MRRPVRSTLYLTLLGAGATLATLRGVPAAPPEAPDPARVAALAAALPEAPEGVGRPIDDRAAWGALAKEASALEFVKDSAALAAKPLPPLTDEIYLDYSKTGNRDRGQAVISERHGRVARLALAECLEDRGRFLEPLSRALESVLEEKSWLLPAHDGALRNFRGEVVEIDLGSAGTSWNLATLDYWLARRLDPALRARLRAELERRTLRPFEAQFAPGGRAFHWLRAKHNWNAVCHACVVGTALAAIEPKERRAFFLAAAERHSRDFLSGFTEDGYCSEGLGYWNYGFGHFVLLAETARRATSGKLDLLADPQVAPIASFAARLEIIPGIFPAFADCSPEARPDTRLEDCLARRLGVRATTRDTGASRQPTASLFTYGIHAFAPATDPGNPPPSGTRSSEAAPPGLRDWFQEAGVLIVRGPTDSPAFGAALKGGHNAEHHNHNDLGSFVVAVSGETPALDPGLEIYTARTFSAKRYESGMLNSLGHPVPRVAGTLQRTGRAAEAKVLEARFGEETDVLTLDLRSAYEVPELRRLERRFTFSRKSGGSLEVLDTVEFSQPKEFETAIITRGPVRKIEANAGERERGIVLGSGNGTLKARIHAEAPFDLEELEIDENVRGRKPTRIGIRLREPVLRATMGTTFTPIRP